MKIFGIGYVVITCLWMGGVTLKTFMSPEKGSWPDWIAAFGTLGAFAGTIWIASAETRRRMRQEDAVARIISPVLAMRLTRLIPALEASIRAMAIAGHEENIRKWCSNQLISCPLWSAEEMEKMVCLPDDCAINMSIVKEYVLVLIECMGDGTEPPHMPVEMQMEQLSNALKAANKCLDNIRSTHWQTD